MQHILSLYSFPGIPTYNLTDFAASEVLYKHKCVLASFAIGANDDELDLPYDAEFIQSLLSTRRNQFASKFNFTYMYVYINDVLSINNTEFENYLYQTYPVELEIEDTTGSVSLLLLTWIYPCRSGGMVEFSHPLMTNVTICNFHIKIFPSNIPTLRRRYGDLTKEYEVPYSQILNDII